MESLGPRWKAGRDFMKGGSVEEVLVEEKGLHGIAHCRVVTFGVHNCGREGGIDEGDEIKEGEVWVLIDVMWEKLMKAGGISYSPGIGW